MMIRQKIENALAVTVTGVDLTGISNVEFYIRQGDFFYQCTPEIVDKTMMRVTIPKKEADRLRATGHPSICPAQLQFAYTDAAGVPRASDVLKVPVGELLKESGYDG